MAKDPKIPNIPTDDDETDPADAFARVPMEALPPLEPPSVKPGKSKRGRPPRSPVVERVPPPADIDDEGMDPMDAAEEILGLMDQMFALACMFRGYDKLQMPMPDGSTAPILPLVAPDDKAKARTKKAIARMLKTAGASMSPGMGLAFTAFGCYGAPIIALEAARAATKRAS